MQFIDLLGYDGYHNAAIPDFKSLLVSTKPIYDKG
jgi:hypothetical protein